VWTLLYMLVTLAGVVVLIGVPLAFAFSAGWLRQPKEHVLALVLGGILLFFLLAAFFVVAAVILVLTKDFVVPRWPSRTLAQWRDGGGCGR
jgi:hypothetical protein